VTAHRRGPAFWIGAALGWALILFGLRGVLQHSLDTRPSQLARFWIAGALTHDLLLAPLTLALGVTLARAVPGRWRATLQRTLIICAPLALFAYPEVRGYAHILRNPTSLPHNYTANLVLVLAAVAGLSAAVALISARRRPSTVSGRSPTGRGRGGRLRLWSRPRRAGGRARRPR